MAKKKADTSVKKLVTELKELYLRDDTEIAGRGLYHRVKANPIMLGGSIDKNVEMIARIKDIIFALEKAVK